MSDKIFVQIASYRDPELLPTIRDCIENADNPDDLVFGIAWQHSHDDAWDNLDEYKDDPRFRILDINYKDSGGACWARHSINNLYKDEKYMMQIDSHHRFVSGWDTKCKIMMQELIEDGYPKPVLTAYVPSYDPENDPGARANGVWKLDFDRFTAEGIIFICPVLVDDIHEHYSPIPTRFFSGHFSFTFGSFIKEVPYDPELYFHGEEITMAVRAYTHGYDLFVPHKMVCWHEYTRKGRVRHWDETANGWVIRNDKSLKRAKQLLGVDGDIADYDFGVYGLGTVRTMQEYEEYSGIRFSDRAVQQYTLDHLDPPNPIYRNRLSKNKIYKNIFKYTINVLKQDIKDDDFDFWVIIFKDEKDNEMFRKDAQKEEIDQILTNPATLESQFYEINREFHTKKNPHKWVVWPHSKENGWATPVQGFVAKI